MVGMLQIGHKWDLRRKNSSGLLTNDHLRT